MTQKKKIRGHKRVNELTVGYSPCGHLDLILSNFQAQVH